MNKISLPKCLYNPILSPPHSKIQSVGVDIRAVTTRLWTNAPIRYGLMMQLVASIAGYGQSLIDLSLQTLIVDRPSSLIDRLNPIRWAK